MNQLTTSEEKLELKMQTTFDNVSVC